MVRSILIACMLLGAPNFALATCGNAISEFEAIINSDLETGNVAKRVHARMIAELAPVKATCMAGRDADARRALAAVKSRHGYR